MNEKNETTTSPLENPWGKCSVHGCPISACVNSNGRLFCLYHRGVPENHCDAVTEKINLPEMKTLIHIAHLFERVHTLIDQRALATEFNAYATKLNIAERMRKNENSSYIPIVVEDKLLPECGPSFHEAIPANKILVAIANFLSAKAAPPPAKKNKDNEGENEHSAPIEKLSSEVVDMLRSLHQKYPIETHASYEAGFSF